MDYVKNAKATDEEYTDGKNVNELEEFTQEYRLIWAESKLKNAVNNGKIDAIPPIIVALFICEKRVVSFGKAIERFGMID